MKLYWLRNIQAATLELPLKDYSGQPLVFKSPGKPLSRRCIRDDVRSHPLIEKYIAQRILVDESEPEPKSAPQASTPAPDKSTAVESSTEEVASPEPSVDTSSAESDALTTKDTKVKESEETDGVDTPDNSKTSSETTEDNETSTDDETTDNVDKDETKSTTKKKRRRRKK